MDKLVVIDANSLMHRAYHALPPTMTSKDGVPTNAIFGFLTMLIKVIERYSPDYLLCAFDTKAPTYRHIAYEQYKGTRKSADDELKVQFPIIKDVLRAMGITVGEQDGLEADDFLGVFSRHAMKAGMHAYLVTGDKDALQLVTDEVTTVLTKKGISDILEVTPQVLMQDYGLTQDQMIDLKALMGDSSDNIPGVRGVGEKTALKLLLEYKTLDAVLENAKNIKGKLGEKLQASAEDARLSKRLVTVVTEAETALKLADCEFHSQQMSQGAGVLRDLQLNAIIRKINDIAVDSHSDNMPEVPDVSDFMDGAPESYLPIEKISVADMAGLGNAVQTCLKAEQVAILLSQTCTLCDSKAEYSIAVGTEGGLTYEQVLEGLAPLFKSDVNKVVFDAKATMHSLSSYGMELTAPYFDALIASYVLNAGRSTYLLQELLSENALPPSAHGLYLLCERLKDQVAQSGMEKLLYEIELPLVRVLFDMEKCGFCVDRMTLKALSEGYETILDEQTKRIYELAGETFNINSPSQLGVILFEKLGLPTGKKTKTGYSTDAQTLEGLEDQHEIVKHILEYRKVSKLKSTYIEGLLKLADENGKVHSVFKQTVTTTGRISSTEPNLQNIPIRTQMGREIRKAFVASPGCVLVDADYSQIELRVLAHLCEDVEMIQGFLNGEDIHARTAKEVFGSESKRSLAKAVNFGIVYGISDFGLSKQLGITRAEAKEYIEQYLQKYPGIKQYMANCIASGKEDGYVTTIFGRRRELPELKSSNYNMRSFGERAAMNAPVQGSAADIIKLAMIAVSSELQKQGLKAKLILQVHDELIIDAPADEAERVQELLKNCMQDVCKLSVPLTADVSCAKNWYDAK